MATTSPHVISSPEAEPAPARLFIAPSRGYHSGSSHGHQMHGVLGQLAQFYGLDVNGGSRLTRRAGIEMGYVALLLTIIFLFDLVAWTLLWNVILQSGIIKLSLWTIPALFGGLLFAFATFIYERQFMTADTSGGLLKILWPVSIRLAVITIAAAITSQPIELLVFKGPIDRRIHDESVRAEAVARVHALQEAKQQAAGIEGQTGIDASLYKKAEQRSEQVRSERSNLQTQYERAKSELSRAEAAVGAASRRVHVARTQQEQSYWRGMLSAAAARRDAARVRVSNTQADLNKKEEDERYYDQQRKEALQPLRDRQKAAEDDVKRLQNWIAQIRSANAGQSQIEKNDRPDKWQFQDQEVDFFERLRVVADLYTGRPPQWKDAAADDRTMLGTEYGLKEIAEDDADAVSRRMINAQMFARSYWAVVGIAIVIPLLVLALKALLPKELKDYYSSRKQREAGNYEVLVFSREPAQPELTAMTMPAVGHQEA